MISVIISKHIKTCVQGTANVQTMLTDYFCLHTDKQNKKVT